jgi:hypothetical protein
MTAVYLYTWVFLCHYLLTPPWCIQENVHYVTHEI